MRNHTPAALGAARRLRSELSLPEALLWKHLRRRPCGLKFRRQHPFGPFVVDFHCDMARLVIEIDGKAHDMGDRPLVDRRRDAWLRDHGLTIIRFPAAEVLRDVHEVLGAIGAACTLVPPPSALRAATSPAGGGVIGIR